MRAFAALVSKDVRLYLSDGRAVLMSIIAPIVISSFFGFIFGGEERKDASRVAIEVVDEDHSRISTALAGRLAGDKALEVKSATLARAREDVRQGKTVLAVLLPAGFGTAAGSAFFNGAAAKAVVNLLYDPSRATEAAMVEGILAGHVMETMGQEMFSGPTGREAAARALTEVEKASQLEPREKEALVTLLRGVQGLNDAAGATTPGAMRAGLTIPYDLKKQPVTSRAGVPYNGYAHAFAGMGVQFILFMGIEMGVGLLLQRRQGLWKRLRAAPLSRTVLLGSRAVSTALISLFILLCLFLFAGVVFGVRPAGSVAGFLAVCLAFSLMTAAFGLLIAGLGKTPDAARGVAIVATLLLVMLGGAWVPTFVFPQWLQRLTVVIPTRWAVDGLDATTWRGLGFSAVAWPVALLLATSLACGALAVARFRWEAE